LSQLSSIFVLTLAAPLVDDEVAHGFVAEVSLPEVERAVSSLPYCDVELEGDSGGMELPDL
jgi:hypothetical protein